MEVSLRVIRYVASSIKALSLFEKLLWAISSIVVLCSLVTSASPDPMIICSTLVGVTALIFTSHGDVLGQILIIVFSLLYAAVSFRFAYYGEVISYVFMTGGIALISTISWIRNPYSEKQVRIGTVSPRAKIILPFATVAATVVFYFILKWLGTSKLLFSTISIATSFFASALTVLRSPLYAAAYCLNDIVLIILWAIASAADPVAMPMIICFSMFLINDIYGFVNWTRIKKNQRPDKAL